MIARACASQLGQLAKSMPAIGLVGPRQSGKTTLARFIFPRHQYVSLEDLDNRAFAREDPRGFLAEYQNAHGIILDEVQHAPDLLSYIQTIIDQNPRSGYFVITGSQNLLVNEAITQTLAGRIAIVTLYPFSLAELSFAGILSTTLETALWKGCFPRVYTTEISPAIWYANYIQGYVERDVRQVKNIFDLSLFQRFLKLCAGRIGQVLNITSLSSDAGVDQKTARAWLSLLEATYVITLLPPFYKNFGKRLIKSPKLYFLDTGLACSLLSITKPEDLDAHYARGALMESYIIADFYKQAFNQLQQPSLYFWRDQRGVEMDVLIETARGITPVEIKAGMTIGSDYFKSFTALTPVLGVDYIRMPMIVYSGTSKASCRGIRLVNWSHSGGLYTEVVG